MFEFNMPITDIISDRYSCRTYAKRPLDFQDIDQINGFIESIPFGPLGNQIRFELVAATEADSKALRGLGTYGFIKDSAGFIVGAMQEGEKNLEDFGYLMELIILKATDLGLGTCWLGGTFNKSRFARNIALQDFESIPAVTSLGYIGDTPRWVDGKIREAAGSDGRLPWKKLFFDQKFNVPLNLETAQDYSQPLEMVRLGPSASNRQPWRIIRDRDICHFYLRRTRGYRTNNYAKMLNMADLQRVDMGIAMCHFELTLREMGISGSWQFANPGINTPDELIEYSISWVGN